MQNHVGKTLSFNLISCKVVSVEESVLTLQLIGVKKGCKCCTQEFDTIERLVRVAENRMRWVEPWVTFTVDLEDTSSFLRNDTVLARWLRTGHFHTEVTIYRPGE